MLVTCRVTIPRIHHTPRDDPARRHRTRCVRRTAMSLAPTATPDGSPATDRSVNGLFHSLHIYRGFLAPPPGKKPRQRTARGKAAVAVTQGGLYRTPGLARVRGDAARAAAGPPGPCACDVRPPRRESADPKWAFLALFTRLLAALGEKKPRQRSAPGQAAVAVPQGPFDVQPGLVGAVGHAARPHVGQSAGPLPMPARRPSRCCSIESRSVRDRTRAPLRGQQLGQRGAAGKTAASIVQREVDDAPGARRRAVRRGCVFPPGPPARAAMMGVCPAENLGDGRSLPPPFPRPARAPPARGNGAAPAGRGSNRPSARRSEGR